MANERLMPMQRRSHGSMTGESTLLRNSVGRAEGASLLKLMSP
jgi:hypothetical protein